MIYMDDTLLGGDEFQKSQDNVTKNLQCVEKLWFFIHPDKSTFTSTQNIIFLGFHKIIPPIDHKKQRLKSMQKI